MSTAAHIARTEGVGTFFAGLGPRAFRIVCAGEPAGKHTRKMIEEGLHAARMTAGLDGPHASALPCSSPRLLPAPAPPPVFILNGTRNTIVDAVDAHRQAVAS